MTHPINEPPSTEYVEKAEYEKTFPPLEMPQMTSPVVRKAVQEFYALDEDVGPIRADTDVALTFVEAAELLRRLTVDAGESVPVEIDETVL